MKPETKKKLEDLHAALAETLLDAVKNPAEDGKGQAAMLNVARQFLKDNGIDSVPSANPLLQSLTTALPFPAAGESEYVVN